MARLRIRVELNRGGVGVPLHKLASVVEEARKFLNMLAEDVHIETGRGEWLAFDFDNESLNFTAEYVGPASTEQVSAFAAAFDGITSLRRATIAQFTRITEAIGEDELIGFGLYHSDHETEPSEWRCLSRRDALRIADEIQLLLGASGELDQATHLPAVIDAGIGARMFKDRHERISADEQSKWPTLVREVEANLSKRIARLEGEVEGHTQSIRDLRDASGATEESVRGLLSSVEAFCSQATHQLERFSAHSQLPAGAASESGNRNRRALVIASVVVIGLASAAFVYWSSRTPEPAASKVSAASVTPPEKAHREPAPAASVPPPPRPQPAKPAETASGVMRVDIEAREPAWVAVTDLEGKRLMAKTLEANETRSFEITGGATLRTGNAGGLIVRFNGESLGTLGPTGKIRDVVFRNGKAKIRTPDAG